MELDPTVEASAASLRDAIKRLGAEKLIDRPALRRNVLGDLFAGDPRSMNVLAAAADDGVIRALHRAEPEAASVVLPKLARELADASGLEASAARWAVDVWARALGIETIAPVLPAAPSVSAVVAPSAPAASAADERAPVQPREQVLSRVTEPQSAQAVAGPPSRTPDAPRRVGRTVTRVRRPRRTIIATAVVAAVFALGGTAIASLATSTTKSTLSITETTTAFDAAQTFTTNSPRCPAGSFTNHASESDRHIETTYTCRNGSGTFHAAKVVAYTYDFSGSALRSQLSASGSVTFTGGTGRFAHLTGVGTYTLRRGPVWVTDRSLLEDSSNGRLQGTISLTTKVFGS